MKICIKCKKEKSRESFHKDRTRKDKLRPYCRECVFEYNQANKEKKAAYDRQYTKSKRHGITLEYYKQILKKQNNKCGLCLTPFGKRNGKGPVIDHCHNYKIVRGIIHNKCNVGIAQLGDNAKTAYLAYQYLKNFEKKNGRTNL